MRTSNWFAAAETRDDRDALPAAGPFGAGRLGGRAEALAEADFDRIEALAAQAGRSLLDVAIGGLAARPGVSTVIAGATTPDQVRANVAAGSWVPGSDEIAQIDGV
jgi:aryl-alcohol dehydrogenase-like predicted oxidoreductase